MPVDQTIKKLFMLHNILVNVAFQSHSTNHGVVANEQELA